MSVAKKYYVVWKGRRTGIYDSWQECREVIGGFPDARYKAFPTLEEARAALEKGPAARSPVKPLASPGAATTAAAGYSRGANPVGKPTRVSGDGPIRESICVDAAWNTYSGDMEYQGIHYATGTLLFHQGPFPDGTNNIGEFLAIVHALGYCKSKGLLLPIYSDSRNALLWVGKKHANTKLEKTARNAGLFDLVERAEGWLRDNSWQNRLLKWETEAWGENPADFGRK